MWLNISLGHFITMKILFNLSSGIKFLTSVKLNLILSRGILYISGCLGSEILVINLPTRSLLVNVSTIFLLTCMWSSVCILFWHLVEKTFSPTQHSSSLIYSFTCVCGRTNQHLDSRIKQYEPMKLRQRNYFADQINNTYRSSIAEHLINKSNCALSDSADLFSILSKSHLDYHLKVLETIHILTHKLSFCKQR